MADQCTCTICNMPFKSQGELDMHNRQAHPTAVGGAAGGPNGSAGGEMGKSGGGVGEKKRKQAALPSPEPRRAATRPP